MLESQEKKSLTSSRDLSIFILVMNTHENQKAIDKLIKHLGAIHALCEDLSGSYDPLREIVAPLMALYGECFNHIAVNSLQKLGMSKEDIHDLVISFLDEDAQEAVKAVSK